MGWVAAAVGAAIVRAERLPRVRPFGDPATECGARALAPTTAAGRSAARLGWTVLGEERIAGHDAVLVARGCESGTSGLWFAREPRLAVFRDGRLVALLAPAGRRPVGMNAVERVGDKLRLWDDLSAVGDLTMRGGRLRFDAPSGSDAVCGGSARVPVVFRLRISRARAALLRAGWTPATGQERWDDARTLDYRRRFPEADACSGTGYAACTFTYRLAGATLAVETAGEEEDPRVIRYEATCRPDP